MSFFSHKGNIRPGVIECDPTVGLRHRVAISATRILDCAIDKQTLENALLPPDSVRTPPPVRFLGAQSHQTSGNISNLEITPIRERPNFARIRCDVTIPLRVRYECAAREQHECSSHITLHEDIILFTPSDSIFPFEVVANTSCQATTGRVQDGDIVATLCSTVIIKIVTQADILLPTYGHVPPPPAVNFSEDACRGFFDLPLYPVGQSNQRNRPKGGR